MRNESNLQKIRFVIVGIANTGIDFGIFFSMSFLGVNALLANYISTTTALIFSYIANKKFTFRSKGRKMHHEIALFLVVTLFGLWILQPLIIFGVEHILTGLAHWQLLIVAKVLATCVTLVWNYVMYKRFVFRDLTDI